MSELNELSYERGEALKALADSLVGEYTKRVSHCQPQQRGALLAGYREGLVDLLRAIDWLVNERNTIRPAPDESA